MNVFYTIKVSFLLVWNTQEDINQAFSRASERLQSNDTITLLDFQ